MCVHVQHYNLLHCVSVSCSHAHVLTKQLADATFADGAAVVMDTAKYVVVTSAAEVVFS